MPTSTKPLPSPLSEFLEQNPVYQALKIRDLESAAEKITTQNNERCEKLSELAEECEEEAKIADETARKEAAQAVAKRGEALGVRKEIEKIKQETDMIRDCAAAARGDLNGKGKKLGKYFNLTEEKAQEMIGVKNKKEWGSISKTLAALPTLDGAVLYSSANIAQIVGGES